MKNFFYFLILFFCFICKIFVQSNQLPECACSYSDTLDQDLNCNDPIQRAPKFNLESAILISKCLFNLTKLVSISLDYERIIIEDSQLSDLNIFNSFSNLNSLTIKNSSLDLIPNLDKANILKILNLPSNLLTNLTNNANIPKSIEIINLVKNKISFIQKGFFEKFKQLTELNLDFNQLKILDLDIQVTDIFYFDLRIQSNNMTNFSFNFTSHPDMNLNIFGKFNNFQEFPLLYFDVEIIHMEFDGIFNAFFSNKNFKELPILKSKNQIKEIKQEFLGIFLIEKF